MVEVSILGVEAVRAALERLRRVAGLPDDVSRDVGIVVERRIKRSFAAQTAPELVAPGRGDKAGAAAGEAWAPLAAETLRRRRKGKGKGSVKILQDTDKLKQSIAQIVAGGSVTVGTGIEYGPWQQGGTSRMPARPFVGINAEDRGTITQVVMTHWEAAVK